MLLSLASPRRLARLTGLPSSAQPGMLMATAPKSTMGYGSSSPSGSPCTRMRCCGAQPWGARWVVARQQAGPGARARAVARLVPAASGTVPTGQKQRRRTWSKQACRSTRQSPYALRTASSSCGSWQSPNAAASPTYCRKAAPSLAAGSRAVAEAPAPPGRRAGTAPARAADTLLLVLRYGSRLPAAKAASRSTMCTPLKGRRCSPPTLAANVIGRRASYWRRGGYPSRATRDPRLAAALCPVDRSKPLAPLGARPCSQDKAVAPWGRLRGARSRWPQRCARGAQARGATASAGKRQFAALRMVGMPPPAAAPLGVTTCSRTSCAAAATPSLQEGGT